MPDIEEIDALKLVKKSEVDAKAEQIRQERALPAKPGDRVEFRELREWLTLLEPKQLQRLNIYVYRLEPIINRQAADPESDNNIDVIYDVNREGMTEQYFIDTHGGGKYKLVVKDLDKPKTQKGGFFEGSLYIPMTQYPPKLDLREVEWDNPRNKGFKNWARAQKLIDESGMPTIEKKETTQQPSADTIALPMVKMFMEFFDKQGKEGQERIKRDLAGNDGLGKDIGAILLEKMKQDNPANMVTMMTQLIGAMKSNEPKQVAPTDPLVTILPFMQMMQESNNKTFTMMMAMMDKFNKPSEPVQKVDDLERLEKLLSVAQKLKGGGSGPVVAEAEETTMDKVISVVSAVGPQFLTLVNTFASRMGPAGSVPAMGNVPLPPPPANAMEAMERANNANIQQPRQLPVPQQIPVQETKPEMFTVSEDQKQMMLRQFAPVIEEWLTKDGWEFAEWLIEGYPQGKIIVPMIIKDGADGLLTTLKALPDIWAKWAGTYGEPHLNKWVHSFVNYKEESEKADEGEE